MHEKELKTSHLLFDEAPLLVRPELAVRVGLNESIVLQQVHYWLENKRKSTKERDLEQERTYQNGRFWTYDTYEQWQEQFPFWSVSTIERIFKSLEKSGVLLSDNFNHWKADRTKWYTIDYDALDKYEKPKRKSKHDKTKSKKADVNQSVKLTESDLTQSIKLTESATEQSVKLTGASPQVDVSNPSSWGEDSVNLTPPIPKSSSKISSETSDGDFVNSSSSIESNNDREVESVDKFEDPSLKEEEEEFPIKRALTQLGCELADKKVFRNNKQINEALEAIVERGLFPFTPATIALSINHYKEECAKQFNIAKPVTYYVNGFEIVLDKQHSGSVGSEIRKSRERAKQRASENRIKVPLYNWLED